MLLLEILVFSLIATVCRVSALPQQQWAGLSKAGFLQSNKNWAYLSQFCFGSEKGVMVRFEYDISYPKGYCCQNILIYDEYDWPEVQHNTTASCEAKERVLVPNQSQRVINLIASYRHSGCSSAPKDGNIECKSRRMFLARRSCWHLVISNCDSSKGLQLQYQITIEQDQPGELEASPKSTTPTEHVVTKDSKGGTNHLAAGQYLVITTLLMFGILCWWISY